MRGQKKDPLISTIELTPGEALGVRVMADHRGLVLIVKTGLQKNQMRETVHSQGVLMGMVRNPDILKRAQVLAEVSQVHLGGAVVTEVHVREVGLQLIVDMYQSMRISLKDQDVVK